MKTRILLAVLVLGGLASTVQATDKLAEQFRSSPEQTKPWCYWYWISDQISREGITRDLEAMARVGIGEALVGNIFLDDNAPGKVKVLSEEWWALVEHAIREGGRTGVKIGMFNCPGWSQSGGPWIKPGQAMRYLVSSETRVKGPAKFAQRLGVPKEPFQDVALLAFPAPEHDSDSLGSQRPSVSCTPAAAGVEKLIDGDLHTAVELPGACSIDIHLSRPLTARSLALTPGEAGWSARCELLAAGDEGPLRPVKSFAFDRSNMAVNVGPIPRGAVTVSFPATTARRFQLRLARVTGKAGLAELNLSGAARVESFIEKQLGKMHPTPLPTWDSYLWPAQPEPERAGLGIAPREVLDLSSQLASDGTLHWSVPAGDWIVLRTGMTPTGTRNSPASPEGQGLEVDKMNRAAAQAHFQAFIGQLLKRMPASERKAFARVVADSYEMGSQNWTDGLATTFRQRLGYDPIPWLPVLTGRIVGSADQSNRFLWDLRRLVADQIATDYVGALRDFCRPHGLELWLENYGHWGFPAEFLQYGGQSDRIGGEFWATGELGSIELRAASSCANTYGRPIVSAEAFTGGPPFRSVPSSLKARGDWAFCEGINHFVLHVYIHQPWEDRRPGVNTWFGTEFNRHNTWFQPGRAWVDYLRRCCWLLQQGTRVADVAYFIGEDVPKMTGVRQPERPAGCDFDYINAEVIRDKLGVANGLLTLPHGATYRALVLPDLRTMRPEVLRKIAALQKAGAKLVGPAPSRSPSMQDYPACDEEVRRLAAELRPETRLEIPPDFQSGKRLLHTHRAAGQTQIYFVANPRAEDVATTAVFRVSGLAPELWCPVTGSIRRAPVYDEADGTVRMPLCLGPHGSVFVVFRAPSDAGRIVSVTRNGRPLLDTRWTPPVSTADVPARPGNFTLVLWAKPATDTPLPPEANQGVHGLDLQRNDVVFPPHGSSFGDATHAGCGLAVGRNGVSVFEHGSSYFAPVLVHPASQTQWTHVAVVYRDGQPSLYLNGTLARRGLKSRYTVHPPAGADATFRGEIRGFESIPRALHDGEIAQWVKAASRPDQATAAPAIQLAADEATVWQAGEYQLAFADGRRQKLQVASLPEPQDIAGPWEVEFASGKLAFDGLVDWTTRPEEAVRHYSGTAVYRKTFEVPQRSIKGRRLLLDLGALHDLATVRLNGRTLGTLWIPPWQVDVTDALRPGRNELAIEITNAWNNRLVGDRLLPAGKRATFLSVDTVPKGSRLLPAGLLGPVRLWTAARIPRNPD